MARNPSRTRLLEENFERQYQELDNETLREIAAGDVPWVERGHYLFAARRAARRVLLERGAADVPTVPAWDPARATIPWPFQLIALGAALLVAGSAAAAYMVLRPPDRPTDAEVCEALSASVRTTDFAFHYKLSLSECTVDRSAGEHAAHPILARGCIALTEPLLEALAADGIDPIELERVKRFANAPTPGSHCTQGPIPVGEAVLRPGRPWYVRVRL